MIDSPISQHNTAPDTTQAQDASTTTHFPGRSLEAQRSSASPNWSPMQNAKPLIPRWTHSGSFSSQHSPARGSNHNLPECIRNQESPDGRASLKSNASNASNIWTWSQRTSPPSQLRSKTHCKRPQWHGAFLSSRSRNSATKRWSKSLPSLHRWRSDYSHPTANIPPQDTTPH